MESKKRYIHQGNIHNFRAANEIVPFIMNLLNPKSVVDVGCGLGTWLKIFSDFGVTDILGIDGECIGKEVLKINPACFKNFNLEKGYKSRRKYDLAISLEVAEHLSEKSCDTFVSSLTELSNIIVFSAAIPGQGGQNHINEQEPNYWIKKFESKGFMLFDVIRPVFWDNQNVDFWYRQNIFMFSNQIDLKNRLDTMESFNGKHIVHPEIFKYKTIGLNHYKDQFETLMKALQDEET